MKRCKNPDCVLGLQPEENFYRTRHTRCSECKTCAKKRVAATNKKRWSKYGRDRGEVTPEYVEMMKLKIREEHFAQVC